MPPLTIPKRYYSGFEAFAKLNSDEEQELLSALSAIPPTLLPDDLVSQMEASVKTVPHNDVRQIIKMLISLYYLRNERETIDELADNLAKSVNRTEDITKSESWSQEDFRDRLIKFLNLDGALQIASKADAVLSDHDHTFCNARVITDIRPVFGSDLTASPAAAVVVHMLKIGYHENKEHKEFFVALDTSDVRDLQNILERANTKARSLKTFLGKTDAYYLDVE